MSYQVIRVQTFSKQSLSKIGGETERTTKINRNEDIDDTRTPFNLYYKKSEHGLYRQWQQTVSELNASFKETKKSVAFEGIVITSDTDFFKSLGWQKDLPPPQKVIDFFNTAYKFVLREIGYHGTDKNILSASIHLDETTPHLQLYYIPVVDTTKKKVYEKDEHGKVLRNEKGSPVQQKDKLGKSVYEYVPLDQPKICHSDFWEQRGGQLSYGNLQDDFYESVSLRYGLERGEVGSNKKHTTKYEWQKQNQEAELKSFQEYLDAFNDAINGKKPFFKGQLEKQIVGLTAQYKRLEQEKKINDNDRQYLFEQVRKYEKTIPELSKYKELFSFLQKYAPDKLNEAKTVANSRKTDYSAFHTKPSNNYRSK